MNETAKKYAFVLGREQEICLEELKAVLSRFCFSFSASSSKQREWDIYRISGNVVFAKIDNFSSNEMRELIGLLAGTIKIYELVDSLHNDIAGQLANLILKRKVNVEGKINFGVSCFNTNLRRQQINSFALTAKKRLKGKFSLRYVESRDSGELSSILTLKNNLVNKGIEFGLFDEEIGVLVALNNPEEWNERDYGKPASDKYSGMVPPKLARMMVNLALQYLPVASSKNLVASYQLPDASCCDNCVVVDPFCGSGNILLEAMMLGCGVIGSDLSIKAVEDSRKNCDWLSESYQLPATSYKLFQSDATSEEYLATSYKLLTTHKNIVFVTEPYLGQPKKFKSSYNATAGEYAKVSGLYLSFLKNIAKLLNGSIAIAPASSQTASLRSGIQEVVLPISNNSTIQPCRQFNSCVLCLIFPLVETQDQGQFSLYKECVDEIKKLGYTQIRPTMIYGRDYQIVKREIVLLKYEQKQI